MNYFAKRLAAFKHAFAGLLLAFKHESHFRIHVLALLIVLNLGFYCRLRSGEWLAVILCSGMVLALELINSAIEKLCDLVMPEQNNNIKMIKDLSAAAVLTAAFVSLVVGIIIFIPHLWPNFAP